jgi:Fic family protein
MALILDTNSPAGQFLSDRNRARQYDFLQTSFAVSMSGAGLEIDQDLICSLNFYATQYISLQPGRYRRHYNVKVGEHTACDWPIVQELMDEFVDILHKKWSVMSELESAAYALWAVNHIHPFCDGNGRTSRALSYFVLCKKLGQWPRGSTTIMELIRGPEHELYCQILQRMHDGRGSNLTTNLAEMASFLDGLLLRQIQSAPAAN